MLLHTTLRTRGPDPAHLVVSGELDIASARELRFAVADALGDPGVDDALDLDCRSVTFIDGAGMGAILSARRAAASRDVELLIREPSRQCRRLVDILDLGHLVAAA